MLPPAHRMRRGTDFLLTTRQGTKVSRGRVVVYLHPDGSGSEDPVKVGLIVGKAVGNSVQRHRASRRIRAVMAQEVHRLEPGTLIVVRALAGSDTSPALAEDLRASIRVAVSRRLTATGDSGSRTS